MVTRQSLNQRVNPARRGRQRSNCKKCNRAREKNRRSHNKRMQKRGR